MDIIVNLGAPEDLTAEAASRFIREFLSDPCVISLPYPMRKFIASMAAKKRAAIYAEMLKAICVDGKHPLRHYTESLAAKVSAASGHMTVAAYRYGAKNLEETVNYAREYGFDEFCFIPMFPQNAFSTTVSAKREIKRLMRRRERWKFLSSYCDHPLYIKALAKALEPFLGKVDAVAATFHSVPVKHTKKTPYVAECQKTVELLKKETGFDNITIAWQSKSGRGDWLGPGAVEVVRKMAKDGRKNIAAICPGFACDCTETVVEIGRLLRQEFAGEGGGEMFVAPCLNDSDAHAELFVKLFQEM